MSSTDSVRVPDPERTPGPERAPDPDRLLIQWRIRDLGLRQGQAAGYLGVTPAQFSRCLHGSRRFTSEQMDALARCLGIDRALIDRSHRYDREAA